MRIGINSLSVTYGGGLVNSTNLVRNLLRLDKINDYTIFVKPDKRDLFEIKQENAIYVECPVADGSPFKRTVWENTLFPSLLKKYKIDVFLDFGIYSLLRKTCPHIFFLQVTLKYFGFNSYRCDPTIIIKKILFNLSKRNIDRIIVLSETVRNEVIETYPKFKDRVLSIPIGTDHIKPAVNQNKEFILTISSFVPYKNYLNLVTAFCEIKRRYEIPYKLVIIGFPTDFKYYQEVRSEVKKMALETDVVFPGNIPSNDLVNYFGRAILYVFPSYLEADGATPLEAMASGTPVVVSDIPSVKDSCGDAAIYFNPFDAEELAEVMCRVLNDEELRKRMIQKGLERAGQFTWGKAARRTLAVLEEVYKS